MPAEGTISYLLSLMAGVFVASTVGTIIATEIAFRRTERWLESLFQDEEFKRKAVGFLKDVSKRFEEEYIKPKIESGEIATLVDKLKRQVLDSLLGNTNLPRL
jgi:phosphoserine phosphatase